MKRNRPFVLSIAGFDPSGGAGIMADTKVFENLKVQGLSVCTAITIQNESEFVAVDWVGMDRIEKQIDILLKKYSIEYIKIGLVENLEVLEKVVEKFSRNSNPPTIIWDPILKASAGFKFHHEIDFDLLNRICSKITLVTPNWNEIVLLETDGQDEISKARVLSKKCAVLLTGGHANNEAFVEDRLFILGEERTYKGMKIEQGEKHGSGCVLTSAILSYMANGLTLENACEQAKLYTAAFLGSTTGLLGHHKN